MWLTDSTVLYNHSWASDSLSYLKSIFTYGDNYEWFEYIRLSKYPVDERWKNVDKQVFTHDENNLITSTLVYDGDDQDWVLREKREYQYNSDNKTTFSTKFNWDKVNEVWINFTKVEFLYNSQGLDAGRIYYFVDEETNGWKKMQKTEIIYNELNLEIENSTMYWDIVNNSWKNWEIETITYADRVASSVLYHWDSIDWKYYSKKDGVRVDLYTVTYEGYTFQSNSTWLHDYSEEVINDDAGNILSQASYTFQEADSIWIGQEKLSYSFNDDGQLMSSMRYYWNLDDSEWIYSYEKKYAYNELGIQFYYCGFQWLSYENMWEKSVSSKSFFTNVSSVIETNYLGVLTYPNPCHNQISINFDSNDNETADFQIFSVSGKLIDAGSVEKTNPISVEKLNSGLYLIQAHCGNQIYVGKFIKN